MTDVLIGVVVGDMGHAHDDVVSHAVMLQQPLQIVEHATVVLPSVPSVNLGVSILDVDMVFMDIGQEALQVVTLHIECGFHSDVPFWGSDAAKVLDELAADGRLAAAEGDSSARSQKIQVVDHHLVKQVFGGNGAPQAIGPQTMRIQAIPAMQCASVKSDQCGHALPVNSQSMPRHCDEWRDMFNRSHTLTRLFLRAKPLSIKKKIIRGINSSTFVVTSRFKLGQDVSDSQSLGIKD